MSYKVITLSATVLVSLSMTACLVTDAMDIAPTDSLRKPEVKTAVANAAADGVVSGCFFYLSQKFGVRIDKACFPWENYDAYRGASTAFSLAPSYLELPNRFYRKKSLEDCEDDVRTQAALSVFLWMSLNEKTFTSGSASINIADGEALANSGFLAARAAPACLQRLQPTGKVFEYSGNGI